MSEDTAANGLNGGIEIDFYSKMSSTDLLLGSKSGQMNLLAVESRADEIRKTLDNLLQTLKFAPASLQW